MINGIRWQDILDVLIVAFIIYRVLLLVRSTRALQLVIGLTVIFFSFYVSKKLELFTLGWILNNFIASIALVVVVIFQNEIRRLLFALGRSPFFRKITYVEETLFYEELANACMVMSKRKTGALIVIEREMGLSEFLEAGIKIEADVNTELIVSVFQTASPLHDGALVIGEGKIRAARCVLPLSTRDDLDKDFGTRHRAALGHNRGDGRGLRRRLGGVGPDLVCLQREYYEKRHRRHPEEGATGIAQRRRESAP